MRWNAIVVAAAVSMATSACSRTPTEQKDVTAQPTTAPAENDAGRGDGRLTMEVESRFFRDPDLNGRAIDVTSREGRVTLSGTVTTEEQRKKAAQLAMEVPGVSGVEDKLRVDSNAAGRRPSPPVPAMGTGKDTPVGTEAFRSGEPDGRVNGAWITTKIQAQYFVNPDVRPWNVDVSTTSDGVVHLEGQVGSEEARCAAVEVATSTEGVTRVEDRLRVRQEAVATSGTDAPPASGSASPEASGTTDREDVADRVDDGWITTKINSKYFMDPDVSGFAINVDTREGVVTLRGEVSSEAARRQALGLARNTAGVKMVLDQLTVTKGGGNRTPSESARGVTSQVDDAWVTTKIQSRFYLDSVVRGRTVNVDTKQGVVTLTGTVGSDAERRAAEQLANDTDGVRKVVNQLTVEKDARQ